MKKFSYILVIFFVVILLFLVGYMFISNSNLDDNNNDIDRKFSFKDYTLLLSKRNIYNYVNVNGEYSAVDSIYLDDGKVYFKFKDVSQLSFLDDSIIKKINNLKYDEVDFIFDDDGKGLSLHRLPFDNIVLMDSYRYSSDGSVIVFFENNRGEVYYFSNSQNGNIKYSLFNSIGEVNIKKSNLNNIISFGNYVKDGNVNIYGIDINGNTLNFSFE